MTSNASNESSSPVDSVGDSVSNVPAIDAIDLYVTPVWYLVGIPGNILAFVVWVQRRMRPSSGCYLAALALDECLFLMMQVRYAPSISVERLFQNTAGRVYVYHGLSWRNGMGVGLATKP